MEAAAAQGYAKRTLRSYRKAVEALAEQMRQRGVSVDQLTDPVAETLFAEVVAGSTDRYAAGILNRFRDHLIEHDQAPARVQPPPDVSPRACLRREYERYLIEQRGVTERTRYHCLRFFDRFLNHQFGAKCLGSLNEVTSENVDSFIIEARRWAPRDKTISTHLRALFRFLYWNGSTERDLSKGIPPVRHRETSVPRHLALAEVRELLASVRVHPRNGRRDFAMLLLMARLGLRAPEVVAIELQDLSWDAGELMVRGKGRKRRTMPIPKDVGHAIVDYICRDRRGTERALFVAGCAPFRPFKDGQVVNHILKTAYDQTGIEPPASYVGSAVLRHSLATRMLGEGASLNDVTLMLRHDSLMSTSIYAQHEVETLRSVARPWPEATNST